MKKYRSFHVRGLMGAVLAVGFASVNAPAQMMPAAHSAPSPNYSELGLVSDVAGFHASHLDGDLVNPWGIVTSSSGEWIADNGPGLITSYDPAGKKSKTVINVLLPGGGASTPSRMIANNTRQFVIGAGSKHGPATYLIATEDGTIAAWSKAQGTNAVVVIDNSASGAVYKGLDIAADENGVIHLYAANFHVGQIDEFDGQFNFVQSFTDTNLPASFAPFNIHTIRGRLFVNFAKQALPEAHDDEAGPGNGFVDIFDQDGTLLRRFANQGALNSPWALALAPKNFGKFSGSLLVGNFGDGKINSYDLLTGKWLGNLTTSAGDLVIQGLWGLAFDKQEVAGMESNFTADRLYFTSGPNGESDGLFGVLRPVSPSFPAAQ